MNGTTVQNQDLVKTGRKLIKELEKESVDIQFHYVPGHKGHLGNEEADRLARNGANLNK